MSYAMKSVCWSILFLALLLPLALRALRWLWAKISIHRRFQPDFLTPISTLFFKGLRDNVNYSAPGENYFVILVILFTFGACSKIAELFLKWFPGIANLPDSATGVVGMLGFATFLFGLLSFLRESKPEKGIVSERPGLSRRAIILLIPTALVIIVLVLAFIYPRFT